MRFSEFSKLNEDIGLPTEKGVTGTFGSYRPGSDKKVWGTGKTAKAPYPVDGPAKVYSHGNNEYYNTTKDDPLSKTRPGADKISTTQPTTAQQTPATKVTTPNTMSTADRFRQVDNGQIKPNIKSGVPPTTPAISNVSAPVATTTAPASAAERVGYNAGQKFKAGLDSFKAGGGLNGLKAGAQTLGKKALGRVVPGAASVMDTADAIRRYNNGDKSGAVIAALGAAGGLVPGFGLPVSLGAAGLNQAIDYAKSRSKQANAAPTQQQAAPTQQQAAPTQQQAAPTQQQAAPTQQSTIQPPAQPRQLQQPKQSYAGTAGAQAIQRANPNIIKNVNDITAGDTINLPNGQQYTIKQGDTLDKIAQNQSTAQAPIITPRPSITQTQSSNTPATTSSDNEKTNVIPNDDMAEEVNPLHRIKSLAGLK
jgi:hypothetical protein